MNSRKLLALAGIIAAPLYFLTFWIVGLIRPDYSFTTQVISQLMVPVAPYQLSVSILFTIFDALAVIFAARLIQWVHDYRTWRSLGYAGAAMMAVVGIAAAVRVGFVPMAPLGAPSPGQEDLFHVGLAGLSFVAAITCLLLFGTWARMLRIPWPFWIYSLLSGFALIIDLGLTAWATWTNFYLVGLLEKLGVVIFLQWMFVVGIRLYRTTGPDYPRLRPEVVDGRTRLRAGAAPRAQRLRRSPAGRAAPRRHAGGHSRSRPSRDGKSRRWRRVLQPKIFIPLLLTFALLGAILGLSDLPDVFGRITRLSIGTLATGFAFAFAYQVFKCLELYLLLRRLDIQLGWRLLVFIFAIGEMTITVPAGQYVENYLLKRTRVADFTLSAAATTALLLVELMVCAAVLAVFPIPHWGWVRPLAIAVFFGVLLFMGFLPLELAALKKLEDWVQRDRVKAAVGGVHRIFDGVDRLSTFGTLAFALVLTAAYLAALAAALLFVGWGAGVGELTYLQASMIYSLALGATLLLAGILTQLGVVEATGLGAAQALGYGWNESLAMLLGFRLVWMGSIWLMNGPAALLLRHAMREQAEARNRSRRDRMRRERRRYPRYGR
jgi:hypothetical protein